MGKEHGKQSGVADELVQTRRIDKVPGKATRDDGADVNSYAFLSSEQRAEYELNFKLRVVAAGARCNDALEAVKIQTLMKRPEDMHWVFGAILELASQGITSWAIKTATKFKAGKIAGYAKQAHDSSMGGDYDAANHADGRKALFQSITDDSIKQRISFIGGMAKTQARPVVAAALADSSDKVEDLSILARLQRSMDVAFQNLGETALKNASDGELLVLVDAMDIAHHSSETYQRVITDWIKRFHASGVERLGRAQDPFEVGQAIERSVTWVQHEDGKRSLWYQERASKNGNVGNAQLTGLVPREFWEEAIAVSESQWGPTPTRMDSPETRSARGVSADYASRMQAAKVSAGDTKTDSIDAARVVRLFGGK